ncbi:MAG: erythromycin esterase family protein [Stackebrandtia sp.]
MTTEPNPPRLSPNAITPLATLDPQAPLDDLEWLDEAIGDARVVAIGESSHGNREFGLLRTRLLRHLVERHGFGAYALESGFGEGWRVDEWVRGRTGRLDELLANGVTSLMGLWTETRAQLEWLRRHNLAAVTPVGFYGVDLPGSQSDPLPGLDVVTAYLAEADPDFVVEESLREAIAEYAASSLLVMPRMLAVYSGLSGERKNAVTAGLADLAARLRALRTDYVRRTGAETYERVLRVLDNTIALDGMIRELARGKPGGIHSSIRDTAMAETMELILRREDRVVLAAHNAHIQRTHFAFPDVGASTTLGMRLAERLGDGYLAIGTTSASGDVLNLGPELLRGKIFTDLELPEPGSLDAVMAASSDTVFAADLRRLTAADTETIRGATSHRIGTMYTELDPLAAFDNLVHFPRVTASRPDRAAIAHTPAEVREAFDNYRPRHHV